MIAKHSLAVLPTLGLLFCCGSFAPAGEVRVAEQADGATLQNGKVTVTALKGSAGPELKSVSADAPASVTVSLLTGGAAGRVEKVEVIKKERGEAVLRLTLGAGQADVKLKAGAPIIEVSPVKGVDAVEVNGKTSYAVLPDFFGDDVIFDPRRFKSDKLTVPAENFLIGLAKDGNAVVMCAWQGKLSLGKEAKPDARDPRVELVFAGQDKERTVSGMRIEFAGQPVFVSLLADRGIWYEQDVSNEPAQKPLELAWKRPFEAKWRVDFVGKEGAFSKDLMVSTMSFDAWYQAESPGRPGTGGIPTMSLQGLWPYFIVPAFISKDGKKFTVTMYADMAERKKAEKDKALPPNVFERVVVYPMDRRADTALSALTPTDIMRESLGEGPCAYVLDIEGIKQKSGRGETRATCGTFDQFINPFLNAIKGHKQDINFDGKKISVSAIKAGERFTPENEAFLAERVEELSLFVTAVNKRLHEYCKAGDEIMAYSKEAAARSPQVKPLAEKVIKQMTMLRQRCSDGAMKNFDGQCDFWDKETKKVAGEVKNGVYTGVAKTGDIRDGYAEPQDIMVTFCRRCMKGVRQEASQADANDPEVLKFANKVRTLSHEALRSKLQIEGW